MLWVVVILWLVVIGAMSVWLGLRAARTFRHVRATQLELNAQWSRSRAGGLPTLARRTAELQRQIAELERCSTA